MDNKGHVPRMKEQFKDNAYEVSKNESEKSHLRTDHVRHRIEDEREMEEAHAVEHGNHCGCSCGKCKHEH